MNLNINCPALGQATLHPLYQEYRSHNNNNALICRAASKDITPTYNNNALICRPVHFLKIFHKSVLLIMEVVV